MRRVAVPGSSRNPDASASTRRAGGVAVGAEGTAAARFEPDTPVGPGSLVSRLLYDSVLGWDVPVGVVGLAVAASLLASWEPDAVPGW